MRNFESEVHIFNLNYNKKKMAIYSLSTQLPTEKNIYILQQPVPDQTVCDLNAPTIKLKKNSCLKTDLYKCVFIIYTT